MIRPAFPGQRTGFSLVEVLVVIAVLATLAGLITAGVMAVVGTTTGTKNANDINQMVIAMETFKAKFGCYPISKVRLLNSGAYDVSQNAKGQPNNPLDFESQAFLRKLWPNLKFPVDWSGGTSNLGDWTLEGDQCLVFFLGGIPSANPAGVIGFADSPTNPTALPAQGVNRLGPFFRFTTSRLVLMHGATNPFYSYNDVYGTPSKASPFAYFAATGQQNRYNPYFSFPYGATIGAAPVSDCDTLGAMPYYAPAVPGGATQYQNPSSYQIISSGADQAFGSTTANKGVIWNSSGSGATFNLQNGGAAVSPPFGGMDDRTNFCPNILSAGTAQ